MGCLASMKQSYMKRILLHIFLLVCLPAISFGQISVQHTGETGWTPTQYVNDVLLGTGVTAFNVQFYGDSTQLGGFGNGDSSNLNMDTGLILASSNVHLADSFPNNGAMTYGVDNPVAANFDPDLNSLVNFSTNQTAVLEFDFVPYGDTVRFNYIFASEEYNFYVCTQYNDVFGFFLSGPGISGSFSNGAVNLALVPGTNQAVTVTNINDGKALFNQQPATCTYNSNNCPCNSQYYVNNNYPTAGQTVQYNGFTTVLEAKHHVNCGDTYHIKLAICDVSDGALNSGVFLEGGSFSSGLVEVNIASVNGDSTINEGCGSADIIFQRGDTLDTSISYIQILGTATNGVDFNALPDSIVLYPGQFDTIITITPIADAIPEGVEYITIQAISVTVCNDTFISEGTLYIHDIPDLHLQTTSDTVFDCPVVDSLTLTSQVSSGGPPPYLYVWSTGDTASTITVPIIESLGIDTFIVEVWDSCGLFSNLDTVIINRNFQAPPQLDILNDSLVNCVGDSLELEAGITAGNGPFTYQWSTSTNDTLDSIIVTVNGPTQVILTITDVCGRVALDTTDLGIKVPDSYFITMPDSLIYCEGSDLVVSPEVTGGITPYTYSWEAVNQTFDDNVPLTVTINQDTTIWFSVMDDCGSIISEDLYVDAIKNEPLTASLLSYEVPCNGAQYTLDPGVMGGLEPFHYDWSTSDSSAVITMFVNVSQQISVTVTDVCGNVDIAQANFSVPRFEPLEMLVSGDEKLCYGDETTIEVFAVGGAGEYSYEWITENDPLVGELYEKVDSSKFRVIATQPNTHFIRVIDDCGNTLTDTLLIEVEHCIQIPNVITPNADGVNDAFYISNITNFPDAHLLVYNRWGQKVFEAKPYLNNWVPSDEPDGVYFYVLRSGNFPELRGDVTVLKRGRR